MSAHATLSPSSAARWMTCPGSVVMCRDLPDDSSWYADEGTDAHELAAMCLEGLDEEAQDPRSYIGRRMHRGTVVSDEMVEAVGRYANYVLDVVSATEGQLLVEQRLPISQITGEAEAHGTADAVIFAGDELIVCDLKYGRGVVVSAEDNPQLQIYALAALDEFGLVGDFTRVRMVIHQPRLHAVSEWAQSVEDLEKFRELVRLSADSVRTAQDEAPSESWRTAFLMPTTEGCKFCRARGTCGALRDHVLSVVADDFADVSQPLAPQLASSTERLSPSDDAVLANCLSAVDLVENWCKAVRAEVEARLLAGAAVPGYKLVAGKRGARAWSDAAAAEEALKAMRIKHDQMYDYRVISPTSAEKLAKSGDIGPRQWPKLQALIAQTEGRPSVAPASDKRPALVLSADDFEAISPEASNPAHVA